MAKTSKKGGLASYLKAKPRYNPKSSSKKKIKLVSGRREFIKFNEPGHWISTGIRPLDCSMGGKGIPTGRVILVSADASVGKTLLGLHIAKCFQEYPKKPGFVHYIDTEATNDPTWVEKIGVKTDEEHLLQPDVRVLEDLFQYIDDVTEYHVKKEPSRPVFVYVDSLSDCPPRAQTEKEYGEHKQKGAKAAAISQYLETLKSKLARTNVTVLFISQLRNKISVNPMKPIIGDPQATTGGNALGFANSLHLRLRQVYGSERYPYAGAKKKDRVFEQEGLEIEVFVYKSKISFPFRKTFLPLYWENTPSHPAGFDTQEAELNWLADRELIASYRGPDKTLVKAQANIIRLLDGSEHTFVGIPGFKKILLDSAVHQGVGDLIEMHTNSRGNRYLDSEKDWSAQSEDERAPMDLAQIETEEALEDADNFEKDLNNLNDQIPDFVVEE